MPSTMLLNFRSRGLWAKVEAKLLWQVLAEMTREQVSRCVDFCHITDALTTPSRPGDSAALMPQSLAGHAVLNGAAWMAG